MSENGGDRENGKEVKRKREKRDKKVMYKVAYSYRDGTFQERRKKADWLVNAATVLSLIAWAVAFIVWLVLDIAEPDRWLNYRGRDAGRAHWDESLLAVAFALLLLALCMCVAAFIFNKLRMRRKTDKYRKSIFVTGGLTIIAITIFLINFGSSFLW